MYTEHFAKLVGLQALKRKVAKYLSREEKKQMAKKKEVIVEKIEEVKEEIKPEVKNISELEHLHALYAELRARGINSIGDLEVQIARLQK